MAEVGSRNQVESIGNQEGGTTISGKVARVPVAVVSF